MTRKPVHWRGDVKVQPFHVDAQQAWASDLISEATVLGTSFPFGIGRLLIDESALEQGQFRVVELVARMKDGTLVSVPGNATFPPLDISGAIAQSPAIYIHLVIPKTFAMEDADPQATDRPPPPRYIVTADGPPIWTKEGPLQIETRQHNVQLTPLPAILEPRGFDALVIAKIQRGHDSHAKLDHDFIPPILNCNAWPPIAERVLQPIRENLELFAKRQIETLQSLKSNSESNQSEMRKATMQLQAANAALPVIRQLHQCPNIHPFDLYLELARLSGQLAVFRKEGIAPELPLYHHEDLGMIYRAVQREILAVIATKSSSVEIHQIALKCAPEGAHCALEKEWIRNGCELFLAVGSDLPIDRIELLLGKRWLNWKLGAPSRVESLQKLDQAGLGVQLASDIPILIPVMTNHAYFQVEPEGDQWQAVKDSGLFAIAFEPEYVSQIVSNADSILVVDPKSNPRELRFELFVIVKQ